MRNKSEGETPSHAEKNRNKVVCVRFIVCCAATSKDL